MRERVGFAVHGVSWAVVSGRVANDGRVPRHGVWVGALSQRKSLILVPRIFLVIK